MNMPFELHIALRYLLAKRKQAFISVISLISTLGVTVGVMALVIALALMTGLQDEIRDRILGANPHIYVWKTGGIADYRAEVGNAPAAAARDRRGAGDPGQGDDHRAARDRTSSTSTGSIPRSRRACRTCSPRLQSGTFEALKPAGDDLGGILLGKDLAAQPGRGGRRFRVGADARGHPVADGPDSARAAPSRRRHVQPRAVRVRLRRPGSCRSTSAERIFEEGSDRHDPAARRRHLGRPRSRPVDHREPRRRVSGDRLDRDEPVVLFRRCRSRRSPCRSPSA